MTPDQIKTLAEFFRDSFQDDPMGVGDWLAQGGQDPDYFVIAVNSFLSIELGRELEAQDESHDELLMRSGAYLDP